MLNSKLVNGVLQPPTYLSFLHYMLKVAHSEMTVIIALTTPIFLRIKARMLLLGTLSVFTEPSDFYSSTLPQ